MHTVRVRDIIVRSVHLCRPDQSLELPVRAMMEHGIGCVLVVDDAGRLTGILTDRDVCIAGHTRQRRLFELAVNDHMTHTVHYCSEDDPVADATALMRRHGIRRLPVVDASRRPIAVLTLGDIARAFRRFDLHHVPVEAVQLLEAAALIT